MAGFQFVPPPGKGGIGILPSGKPNTISSLFNPGEFGRVNAQIAASHRVPVKGDKPALAAALNNIKRFGHDDQIRIINRAAQAGVVDRGRASQAIQGINPAPVKVSLNPLQKAVSAGVDIAKPIIAPITDVGKQIGKQATYLSGPTSTQQQRDALVKKGVDVPKYKATQSKNIKRGAGDLAQILALGIGGGEAAAVAGAKTGAKQLVKNTAGFSLSGALGNAGYKASTDSKSSTKDILKSGAEGAAIGAALGAGGSALSKGLKKINATPLLPPVTPQEKASTSIKKALKTAGQGSEQTANIDKISQKQPLGEAGGISVPQTNQYVKEQIKLQDAARKANTPRGLARVSAEKSDAKAKLLDSLAPIEDKLNQRVTAENAHMHITPQLDRAIRADTIGAQYIKDKGLAKIIQTVDNTKEFDQYLIAKHAADLEKNGIQSGRHLEADKQLVKELGAKYEPHAKALKEYSQNLLDEAANYGLVSKELAADLKKKYPNYVPVNRIFGENELPGVPKGVGGGNASIGSQSVVQRIKGSNRQIESPLSSLIDKTQAVVKEGERNKAAQILTSYKDLPGNPFQLRELKPDETVGVKHVISVLEDGKQRRFETTPEIAAAAKSLNKEQLGLVGRILAVPSRVLRLGATGLNPAFALGNVTKDTASAFINSSHPLRSSVANPKVFVAALKAASNHKSGEYAELVREGAGGTSFDIARNAPKQNVKAIRAEKNAPSKILYTVTRPAQLFRAAENTIARSEEFNRALQYYGNKQSALAKGVSEEKSRILGAHAARNNTVNFARAGDFGRALNSVLPYLNAGIQGSRTLLRNLKERPLQTSTKLAVSAFLPMAALTAWNTSDPKRKAAYDDIKDYEKQGSFIIVPPHPVKDKNGKWNIIKIPMSQEIANLNNIVRNGVEAAVKDGSINVAQLLGNAVGTATSLNAQSFRQLEGQLTPQALKPGLEALNNKNLFTGSPIVAESQKNLPNKDQIGKKTTGTATKLGAALNISPLQIDNALQTAGGGLAKNLLNISDTGLAKSKVIKPNQVKGESFASSIKGRFAGAQGQSDYDKADAKFSALKNQLIATKGYKQLSTADKAKALNRLNTQVINSYTKPKPTKRQQAIRKGNPDLASYLVSQRK